MRSKSYSGPSGIAAGGVRKGYEAVNEVKGNRLYINLGPSQVRRRLKGVGFGVRKVESAGTNRALIIHTATGEHLRQLEALFEGLVDCSSEDAGM